MKEGTIDILVNNAGIIRRVPMHEMEAADFRRVIDIDLNAPPGFLRYFDIADRDFFIGDTR